MSNFLKKFVSITITILGIITPIITLINGIEGAIEKISVVLGPIFSPIFVYVNLIFSLPFAIFLLIIGIISEVTYAYRKNIGTHGIPCSLVGTFHFKIANKNNKLLKTIHKDIYHCYYKIKDDIHCHRVNSVKEIQERFEELLFIIHSSILKTFKLDLTINVKKLSLDRRGNLCLVPFIHYRSIAERKSNAMRAFNYTYCIETAEYERLSRYAEKAKKYHEDYGVNRQYEVNSIFTYLINHKERFWMSNDLGFEVETGNFYTSSDNYPEFYKSLAVFSIAPPEKIEVLPEGLIIFDTKKTGKFSEKECVQLLGYIAHLFYELLKEYDSYESAKKKKR